MPRNKESKKPDFYDPTCFGFFFVDLIRGCKGLFASLDNGNSMEFDEHDEFDEFDDGSLSILTVQDHDTYSFVK